ncbi:response regulator transcription factor [Microbulbifer harenosus]|uniref:Response regulator transcription factor n=1 Tax=Microbulbifer harenosus TaxID=2576840 RepID=A0ABY2UHU0_9GAMM|nr:MULTISPECIES: response regulator transcription factor [Microbulbifer]QIL91367.1 response regulator [Microbulbifer sp. SH-1]TLM77208.1 response regulator transcription factor [Microbulbifer harenosus]
MNPAPTRVLSTAPARILIAEDDTELNRQIAAMMREAGYQVDSCVDGEAALLEASKQRHQLILLDLMLPGLDGLSLLRLLRKTSQVPVIIVSAKGAEEERIQGLRHGADDYIAKPFNRVELMLRVEALLRRSQLVAPAHGDVLAIEQLELRLSDQQAAVGARQIELTAIQFNLLWELVANRGEVLSKAYLSREVLNRPLGAYDRSLDMHLSRVRRKLSEAGWRGERLQTVRGQGYCLK